MGHSPSAHSISGAHSISEGRSIEHAASWLRGSARHMAKEGARSARLLEGLAPYVFHARSVAAASPATSPADDVFVLAEDPEVSAEMVATDETVFWVDRVLSNVDSIVAVPVVGGLPTTLYACSGDGVSTIRSLASDAGYLYWVEASGPGMDETSYVKRMRGTGGGVESLLARRGRIKQIALSGPFLYAVDESYVSAVRLEDRSETSLGRVRDSSQGPALAADAGGVYWVGAGHFALDVMTAASPTSPWVKLSTRESAVTAMSLSGPTLYWVEYGGPRGESSVFAMDRQGGEPTRLFGSSRLTASSSYGHALLASDAEGAYFMVEGSGPEDDGAIYEASRHGPPRVVVSGIGGPGGVAVAGPWLVFTDIAQGRVVRVPR